MRDYLRAIWRSRHFWLSLVKIDLRNRYRRSVLGIGWSLLHPIVTTVIYCMVFPTIFHLSVHSYAPFLLAGLVFWSYVSGVAISGSQCLYQAEGYIRQYPAPMAIYTLRAPLGGTVHFLFALAVVLGLQLVVNGFSHPLALLSLFPALVIIFLMVWSMSTLTGFSHVFFPDTQHLVEDGLQILFFATPIIYKLSAIQASPLYRFVKFNPLVYPLDLLRSPILDGHAASPASFGIAAAFSAMLFTGAAFTLGGLQKKLIFYL